MKTVAITGAGGFIGRRIADAAKTAGWRVRALVRAPEKLPADFSPVRWDLEDQIQPDLLDGVDAVIHAAAWRPDNLDDPAQAEKCLRVNAGGTLAVLNAAQAAGVSRFIYLSAGNAYNATQTPIPESAQIFPARRAVYYLASKFLGEIYAAHADQAGKISSCILRISSVYGPGMNENGLIAATARKLAAGEMVKLANGGQFGADMVYVDDVAQAAIAALASPFRGAVNVGSGEIATAHQIARLLASMLQADENLIRLEPASALQDGFGVLDIVRARDVLGYRPTTLQDGLARTLDHLREQRT